MRMEAWGCSLYRVVLAGALLCGLPLWGNEKARQLERAGDLNGAREALRQAAAGAAASLDDLTAWAEYLDRRRDPGARMAYEKALTAAQGAGNATAAGRITRRLMILDMLAADNKSAQAHLDLYRKSGPVDLKVPVYIKPAEPAATVEIPGPLRSFNRMAALSPDLPGEDVLGALARNIITNGYQASSSNEALEMTEYLKLVVRYLSLARELEKLAGPDKRIKVEQCESPVAGELLKTLGYRVRGGCGSDLVLETVNATRAFLTIDSGFPLSELEIALRTNKPFDMDYSPSKIQVLYGPEYWLTARDKSAEGKPFVDSFIEDPALCRLYLGLSKLDPETAEELRKAMPATRIRAFAHVLDFYGGMFQIRGGKAIVPGSAQLWTEMAGVSPDQGAAFFEKLVARDDGWLAAFFDSLMRIEGPLRAYLTEPARLKRFYTAIRGRITSPGPARPVFRANTDMMLLTTRLRLEADGKPHVPGGVETWKSLFVNHPHGKYDGKLTKSAANWKDPDDVIEALFALTRKAVENEPLKMFMTLSDLNRRRTTPLTPAAVDRLIRDYKNYAGQYTVFAEAPGLSEKTIFQYLDDAKAINDVKDVSMKSDEAGLMQSLVGLWQIFVRQGLIGQAQADQSLSEMLTAFAKVKNARDLFDAGRTSVTMLMKSAGVTDGDPQMRMLDLLAGQSKPSAEDDAHAQLVDDMRRIFDTQRLISLKTIFDLADNLESLAKGERMNTALVNRLSARILEIQPPRNNLTGAEKNAMAFGYWVDKHIESQRKVNFRQIVERSGSDPEKLREARGLLAQFLRDTLVGFNYVHYAPPGAQVLITNPLFVRSHDFIGIQSANQTWRNTEVLGTGWPSSAGGRLVGSLAGLPYALAEAEQNFLIPTREQALIWGDLVPQMILSAKIPRWWRVSPAQLHWVALHLRAGESLMAEASLDPARRQQVVSALERQASPARARRAAIFIDQGRVPEAIEAVTPSELFVVAMDAAQKSNAPADPILAEIKRITAELPAQANYGAVSALFGTPKPTLAASYAPELLNLRTFPTLMGYSSRILAESWESSTLFYAALADELHLSPGRLNVVIPQWTQKTVERIFATHLEDWPALLRSLRLVGEDVRAEWRKSAGASQRASLP